MCNLERVRNALNEFYYVYNFIIFKMVEIYVNKSIHLKKIFDPALKCPNGGM